MYRCQYEGSFAGACSGKKAVFFTTSHARIRIRYCKWCEKTLISTTSHMRIHIRYCKSCALSLNMKWNQWLHLKQYTQNRNCIPTSGYLSWCIPSTAYFTYILKNQYTYNRLCTCMSALTRGYFQHYTRYRKCTCPTLHYRWLGHPNSGSNIPK